ncbi:hypothetical protein H2248_011911 [Termitomyces sp. 'cryptogamus']|nr:hypothetical protein H2248_011911 [Termitomyces sp. 'cryptogamus']
MFAPRNSCPSDFRNKPPRKPELTRKNFGQILDKAPFHSESSEFLHRSAVERQKLAGSSMKSPKLTASVFETTTVTEAVRSWDANKDCILVLNKSNSLVGIVTSTDIVYCAVAYGLDPCSTTIHQVMTQNPVVARDPIDSSRALMLMVSNKIKHLPICNENGDVLRVLLLTDVFNEYLENTYRKLAASETLYKAVLAARTTLGSNEQLSHMLDSAGELVQSSSILNFSIVAATQGLPVFVGSRHTVRRVAQIMTYRNASTVCIVDHVNPVQNQRRASRQILGLCTTKDIASHFVEFGAVAPKSSITKVMKNSIMRVHSSTSFLEVAVRMLKGHFSDALVEMTDGTSSTVNMLTMSTTIICEGDQHCSLTKHMKSPLHMRSNTTEAKGNPSNIQNTQLPLAKDDSCPLRPNNDSHGRSVAAPDRCANVRQTCNEAPPGYTHEVKSHQLSLPMTTQHSLLAYPLRGQRALLDLKTHYDVFHDYLPLEDCSVAPLNQSAAQHKIIACDSDQLFELSTDVYDELLRRQKIWQDEWIIPFLSCQAGFSSVRNEHRQRLCSLSHAHFQNLVEEVYMELYRRYHVLRKDFPKAHAMIVAIARLGDLFKDMSQYRRLLKLRNRKAQQLLDFFQFTLDMPGLYPELRRNFLIATQRLSSCSGLYPTCYDLKTIELMGGHPVTSGGFADIYKGRCNSEIVCLKVIRVYQTSHFQLFLKRISSEAILWGQLQHPNILPFYGVYYLNARPCLVSPWLDQDILSFLNDNPNVNRRLLVSDVASGVAFLHSREIVHGDLKAANILVNELQRATITDFGLSAVCDPSILHWASHSTAASKGGSVRWQAPELFDDVSDELVHNSKASDVYAFSCVAYEIFTEKLPFFELGKLEATVLHHVKTGGRPSCPTDLSPAWLPLRLTRSLWTLMQSCWHTNPEKRPSIDTVVDHTDLKVPDTRSVNDADSLLFSNFRHFMASRSIPPSFRAIQEILIDLEHLKDEILVEEN